MKTILTVELRCKGGETGSADEPAEPSYLEVHRVFDLPFAPFPGLSIQFPIISSDSADASRFEEALAELPPITGIVAIEQVLYDLEAGMFHVRAYEGWESARELRAAHDQYLDRYQFRSGLHLPDDARTVLKELLGIDVDSVSLE